MTMRKNIKYIWYALAALSLTISSCAPEEEIITPQFPTLVEASVEAGETFKMTIEPNMDWRVNIPTEQFTYFKLLLENGKKDIVQRGKAGKHEIQVVVDEQTEFDNSRVCEVSLTMGDQTQVIARLTKGKMERKANVYVADFDSENDSFVQTENGDWSYSEQATNEVNMVWNNAQWLQRIKVDANFKWTLRGIPAWMITNDVVGGSAGMTEIFIRVNKERWPMERQEYRLELCDMSTDLNNDGVFDSQDIIVVNHFTIALEGCKDVREWSLGERLQFNVEGQYYQAASYSYTDNVQGNVVAPYGMVFRKLTYFNDRYWAAESYSEWATLTVGDYAEGANAEVGVWERSVTISAVANSLPGSRQCVVLMMPQSVADKVANDNSTLVTSDNSAIVEEYQQYVVTTIVQAGINDETQKAVAAFNPDGMMASGGLFEELTKGTAPWNGEWANVPNGYKLTYNSNAAGDALIFANDFANYEIYGPNSQYDKAQCWLTVEKSTITSADGVLYKVVMRLGTDEGQYENKQPTSNGGNEATIIFYDQQNTPMALVHCILDPSFDPYANIEAPVQFADPQTAYQAGATLERIKSGDEEYDGDAVSRGVALYRLTTSAAYKDVTLVVPSYSTIWDEYEQNQGRLTTKSVVGSKLNIVINSTESFSGRVSLFNGSTDVAHIVVVYKAE